MDISDLPDHPDCDPAADPDWADGRDRREGPDRLVLDDQVSLMRAWRHLVGPHDPHRGHGVWLMLIDEDDRPMAGLLEVEHCVDLPEPDQLDSMVAMLRAVLDDEAPGGRVAMLRSRPGTHPVAAACPLTSCTSRPPTASCRCRPTTSRSAPDAGPATTRTRSTTLPG